MKDQGITKLPTPAEWGLPGEYRDGTPRPPTSIIAASPNSILVPLIEWHYPAAETLLDATCGRENLLFRDWLEGPAGPGEWVLRLPGGRTMRYVASDIEETRWNCAGGRCVRWDVFEEPPWPPGSFDIVVYDPPYSWGGNIYGRDNVYGIDGRDPVRFYSSRVIERVARLARLGVVVKGADIYVPRDSGNLVTLLELVAPGLRRAGMSITSVIVYPTTARRKALARYRAGRTMRKKGFRRAFTLHAYLVFATR